MIPPAIVSSSSSTGPNDLVEAFQGLSLGVPTLQKKITQVHQDDIHVVCAHPTGMISGSKDTTIRVWNDSLQYMHHLQPTPKQDYNHWITSLAVMADGSWVSGSRSGCLSFWSSAHALLKQKKVINWSDPICKDRNLKRINCIVDLLESPGHFLVGLPTQLQTWRAQDQWRLNCVPISQNDWLYCVNALQDRRYALVIGSDVEVWQNVKENGRWTFVRQSSLYRENPQEIVDRQRPHIASTQFMNETTLAMALFSGHVKGLDVRTGQVPYSYKEHRGRVWTITKISENVFASGADDTLVKIWDTRQASSAHTLGPHSGRVSCTMLRSDMTLLAASCPDKPHESQDKASFSLWQLRK